MIGLFAQSIFEATRVYPLANAATVRDWHSISKSLVENKHLEQEPVSEDNLTTRVKSR